MGFSFFFFFQAEDGIRDHCVTGVQTCALPISRRPQISEARSNDTDLDREVERQRGIGPGSESRSGDVQGLSRVPRSASQSVEELAGTDQSYEASIVEGVEDAGAHPEWPVRYHSEEMVDDSDRPDDEGGEERKR